MTRYFRSQPTSRQHGARKSRRSRRRLSFQPLESRRLLAAQLLISEFLADNETSIEDAYGDSSDWIEIYNGGDEAADLIGHHLTDDPTDLNKWQFPHSTILNPGQYLVVFASSRGLPDPLGNHHTNFQLDRQGDYLALTSPQQVVLSEYGALATNFPEQATDITYGIAGRVLVSGNSVSEYLIPTSGSLGESWTSNSFQGSTQGFTLGRAAIGYENNPGEATSYANSIQTLVPSGTTNVFLRTHFQVDVPSAANDLQLTLQYDDGAVVYLNGTRVVSLNAPDPLDYNTPATANHDDTLALQGETFDLSNFVNLLVSGQNTLAIHALNRPGSSDFLMVPRLTSSSITGSIGYLQNPTPGGPNALTVELGPQITSVTPSLTTATAGQPLVITASISPFTSALNPSSPRLHYRVMYGQENSVAMFDNGIAPDQLAGDGIFTAQVPGTSLQSGQMVRWYVTAADQLGVSTRTPRFLDALDSAEYYGTIVVNPMIQTDLPVLHWFVANESAASTDAGTRASLFVGGEFYDNIQVNNHGQSTRGSEFLKKSFDFDANSSNKFRLGTDSRRVSDFNLLTNYADQTKLRNTLTYDLFARADYAHHLAEPVMVYRNNSFYGLMDLVEEGDSEYLERLGLNPENPLYKVNNRLDHAYTNVEKKTRDYEDHSDFQEVVTAATTLTGTVATTWDFDHLDIADAINYLAINNVVQNTDIGHKNMYWYRDTLGTGLWSTLPWDQDLSLGHQWDANVSPPYFKDALITNASIFAAGNNVFQRLFANPTFRQMYTRRVRTLADQFYGTAGTAASESYLGQHIISLQSRIADEALLDTNRWGIHPNFTHTPAQAAQQLLDEFIPLRRNFIQSNAQVPSSQAANSVITFDDIDFDTDPVSGLQTQEYIRLNNPNSYAVDISGWQLRGGIQHRFKGGTVIPAGGALYVVKDVAAFQQRTAGPTAGQQRLIQGNYQGQLTYNGETVELVNVAAELVDTLVTPATAPTPLQQFLRVTEIHYNPIASDAEYIELMNISSGESSTTLDLSGVVISEGPSSPFTFPLGTTLNAGERKLVVLDDTAMLAAFPTLNPSLIVGEFLGRLGNSGDRVKVVGAGGETVVDITFTDGDPWPISADGKGASLELIDPVGTAINRLEKPYSWRGSAAREGTPGAPGSAPPAVRINEILAHTDLPDYDSIELYNDSDSAVDIGGWYLSDSGTSPLKYRIPSPTLIPARGWIVFDERNFNPTPLTPSPNHFALSGSSGDSVWLSIANPAGSAVATLVDQVDFGATFNGITLGRVTDGQGRLVPMQSATLGAANSTHATSSLVISEVHYHPGAPSPAAVAIDPTITESDLEFVEVTNHSSSNIDLMNWRLRGSSDFDFPVASIAATETVVVVRFNPGDPLAANRMAAFRAQYGIDASVRLMGPLNPSLGNSYGVLKLQRPDEAPVDEPTVTPRVLVDEVLYDDLSPWSESADGEGASLQRIHPTSLGNNSSSWRGVAPTPGTSRFIPRVESVTVNSGRSTRSEVTSLELYFDTKVNVDASSFLLTNTSSQMDVTGLSIQTEDLGGKTKATVSFTGGESVIVRGPGRNTLDNGNYLLRIVASQVVAATGGASMEQDTLFGESPLDQLFRKFGDHDGDNAVGLLDFASFRRTFGLAAGDVNYLGDLDSDGDQIISLIDFAQFRSDFGT